MVCVKRSVRNAARCAVWLMGVAVPFLVACGDDANDGDEMMRTDGGPSDGGTSDGSTGRQDGAVMAGEPMVELDDGTLQGERLEGASRFLAIPYAKPPLDELRWKAPEPNEPWDGVRHETEFVESCPQLADQGAPPSENEDCLYLNVWTPDPMPEDAPVMVWIHGGGNFSGGAGIPIPNVDDSLWYDGRVFAAEQGVVLVTLSYRLGPLGFLAHPALAEEEEPVGNQGLLDQRQALRWVQENIESFGGDPDNVTIFGESAGSADVCYHVVSPGSRGLFHRAISQSGGCTIRSVGPEQTTEDIASQMVAYGDALGCDEGDDQLECMRDVSVEELLANSMQPMPGAGGTFDAEWQFAAVIDGEGGFLPDTPKALFDSGEIADVPYLLGANHDEGTTFVIRAESLTSEAEYMDFLESRFGEDAEDVFDVYPPSDFDGDFDAARARVIGDSGVVCSTHDTARRAADAGLDVFMYDFNVHWSLAPDLLRAGHAAEISHVFGTPYMADEESAAVADAMNSYWAGFAESGDPNYPDAPAEWPTFTSEDDRRLQLDPDWAVLEGFRAEECAFWRSYYGVDD